MFDLTEEKISPQPGLCLPGLRHSLKDSAFLALINLSTSVALLLLRGTSVFPAFPIKLWFFETPVTVQPSEDFLLPSGAELRRQFDFSLQTHSD